MNNIIKEGYAPEKKGSEYIISVTFKENDIQEYLNSCSEKKRIAILKFCEKYTKTKKEDFMNENVFLCFVLDEAVCDMMHQK